MTLRISNPIGLGFGLISMALAVSTPDAAIAKDATSHIFGPPPSWAQFEAVAEPALQAQLIDPESARFTWAGGYFKGSFKPFLSSRIEGYVGCGRVNGRNRLGGYAGATAFVVVIDYDRVLYAAIADPKLDPISIQCDNALKRGLIPPLPPRNMPGSGTSPGMTADTLAAAQTSSGLSLRVMPDGAYVGAVADGSSAAAAGLKPGMVITAINGIPLAGMGGAMLKVASAASAPASLTLVGGTTIKLGAAK